MPIQNSPPERQTRSQARTQAVLTPTPRAPLDGTPAVPQLRAQLDRGIIMEGAAPSRREGRGPRRSSSFSGVLEENSVEEEASDGTEAAPAPVGAPQGIGRPTLSQSDKPVSHQSEPSLLAIMQQITQIMAYLQAASSSESSRPPAFKTPSMKAPECFDGIQPFKLGDTNEVRKAEAELDSLIIKEGGHIYSYIADFRSLVSGIGDWGERALIYHFRRGLTSRILNQLASPPSNIDSLKDLMDITLELDTRYHERQREKNNNQEKKPESSKSNSSHPQNSSG
ncbi:hypothetical protein O181_108552 [Austropuccinia psidii MF-1]|uniref:Retrotransposon gag domain-containing protein n=1 Tax=Austropuccinia psidii MF-1 TaxID=1389203 RepID=A0A9Q3PQI1_9BASI|nr:hypothetical protein [Austropuccinia psidii MF-1]